MLSLKGKKERKEMSQKDTREIKFEMFYIKKDEKEESGEEKRRGGRERLKKNKRRRKAEGRRKRGRGRRVEEETLLK